MGEALKSGGRFSNLLKQVYFGLDSPAAYAGAGRVYAEARRRDPQIRMANVKEFLRHEKTYTLYYPLRQRFKRLQTRPSGLHTDWQCDLSDFQKLKEYNDGYTFLLVCIDVLSRKIFVAPVRSKRSEDMISGFKRIFATLGRRPHKLYSDAGLEFQAGKMLDFFRSVQVLKYVMRSPGFHAGVVERSQRTIKGRLYRYFSEKNTLRWVDVIFKIVEGINESVNRTTGMPPNAINFDNAREVLQKVYKADGEQVEENRAKPRFKVGDIVRMNKLRGAFDKGYLANYTDELFRIAAVKPTNPPHYKIDDLQGERILGVFYNEELVGSSEDVLYRISAVLKTRTRRGVKEHFVSWVGFPKSQNSWIPASEIVG